MATAATMAHSLAETAAIMADGNNGNGHNHGQHQQQRWLQRWPTGNRRIVEEERHCCLAAANVWRTHCQSGPDIVVAPPPAVHPAGPAVEAPYSLRKTRSYLTTRALPTTPTPCTAHSSTPKSPCPCRRCCQSAPETYHHAVTK